LKAINHLDSAHKSGDAWVRIASSVQAWNVVHWEDPRRTEPIRIPAHLIPINAPPAEDCALEATRTQAVANHGKSFKPVSMSLPKSKGSVSISEHFWISRQRRQTNEKKKVSENVLRRARRNRFIQFERLQAS
jgi:hypothetical protein